MESSLAEKFYQYISIVPVRKWPEFIRILGLPESDIEESYYDNTEVNEQKYQMLSRWKSYYGYNREIPDIVECLKLASEELEGGRHPELLNRKLTGRLNENRQIARLLYEIVRSLNASRRKQFAMTQLGVSDADIDAIQRNYSRDFDEQGYQMLLVWSRRNRGMSRNDMRDYLEQCIATFRNQNHQSQPAGLHGQSLYASPSGDLEDM